MGEQLKKGLGVLRKIHIFPLLVIVLWNQLALLLTVFSSRSSSLYLRKLPMWSVTLIMLVWGIVGAAGMYYFIQKPTEKKAFWAAGVYNFAVPALAGILVAANVDEWYHFGGFMPGLDALGVFLGAIATSILAAVGFVIFLIASAIYRKRVREEKEASAFGRVLGNILNVLSMFVICFFLLYQIFDFFLPMMSEAEKKREEIRQERFQTRMEEKHSLEKLEEVFDDSFRTVYLIQMLADADTPIPDWSSEDIIQGEALEEGIKKYEIIKNTYEVQDYVTMINSFTGYDYKDRTISFCYEFSAIDRTRNCFVDIWCRLIFDENLQYQGIEFSEQRPGER